MAWSGGPRPLPRVPFPVKLLIALVAVVLVFTHLPWILVALLVYLFVSAASPTAAHPRSRPLALTRRTRLRPRWRG